MKRGDCKMSDIGFCIPYDKQKKWFRSKHLFGIGFKQTVMHHVCVQVTSLDK